jgi:hypothetical protein
MTARPLTDANAAQIDRVNVANSQKGFRWIQKLQVVKSTQRSELSRPNSNKVFRASLSTYYSCRCHRRYNYSLINGLFLANFRNVPKIRYRKRTQKLQIVISQKRRMDRISSFLRQSIVISPCQALPKCRV